MQIINAVDERRNKLKTRSLEVSFNELADMYSSNELTVRSEYQRLFRWSTGKQSQFIESLLSKCLSRKFSVIEVEEGKWELIDGLQRLFTYLHFRGELNVPELNPSIKERR